MSKKRTAGIIIIITLIVTAVGAIAWMFWAGYLVYVAPGTQRTVSVAVCDSSTVSRYNDVMILAARNGSTELTYDEEGIKSVKSEIEGLEGNKDDPTCQAMLFWIGIQNNSYEDARTAAARVQALHDEGKFPDNNIRANDALFTYESVLFPLSPEAATTMPDEDLF